ncbi:MAG: DUF3857 domain-containing protein, partial [Planctomycetota bacterium]
MIHSLKALLCTLTWVGAAPGDDDLASRIADAGDASKYPSAACVVVFDDSLVEIEPSGLATTERRYVLKILTDSGIRDQAVQTFEFDPVTNRFQVKRIRVHRAEGEIVNVPLGELITIPAPAGTIFWPR